MIDERRILSRPVELHWAGWKSDTMTLQQNGWDISAQQDIRTMQMGIALRAPHGVAYGMSAMMSWEFMEDQHRFGMLHRLPAQMRFGKDVMVHHQGPVEALWNQPWGAVDAIPQMVETRRTRLEDFAHFAPAPLVRNNPIVIPEESVSDLMDRILKLQQPDRTARIQAALRNPEGYDTRSLPEQRFHAQIISFGKAA
ncbi:hypothetical protein SAMN02983003_0591 [Devosia enhydra]|uniref:Uncharacterized protein n=1 Tax=Devosia enhydra TaxID=665118 RepID=A0A1K2HV80_9HYPH|nr:hypothetical protein [Devosia enhydra]SFZ81608.1 hypothetical protein SAMN02983003_0591 [Devosia enhydra]